MDKKQATAGKAKKAEQAATPAKTADSTEAAAPEQLWQCEVIKINDDGSPFKIGSMNCGVGARTFQPKSKADALVAQGFVRIIGIA